jgi:hypothetical protein
MKRSASVRLLAPLALLGLGSCSGLAFSKDSSGLEGVDRLLSHVERTQVEALVAKERAQEALDALRILVAPEFRGEPAAAHEVYVGSVEASEDQADALQDSVKPLKRTGEKVFERWAEDLESFGNIAMRQRSQERLEATRQRYDAVLSAAVSAQLAYDGFNGDLHDHALFLEHDFNTTSVALIAGEQESLRNRGRELGKRLDVLAAACQSYLEFSAPQAELQRDGPVQGPASADSGPRPAPTGTGKR